MVSGFLTAPRHRRQLAATLIGSVTAGFLLVFLLGEVFAGDWSGLAHSLQVGPLVALLVLGWWRPRLAGVLLVAIGGALTLAYFVDTRDTEIDWSERLLVGGIFLVPPILAGVLFVAAAHR